MLRRRVNGAWRVETLGDWPKLTLLNARRRAARTPAHNAAPITFEDAASDFYKQIIEPRYRTAPGEAQVYLVRDCKTLAKRRLDRITTADYADVVRTKAKKSPGAATKMVAILKQFGRWAAIGELVEADPMASLTARALHLPAYKPRDRVLTADEIKALDADDEKEVDEKKVSFWLSQGHVGLRAPFFLMPRLPRRAIADAAESLRPDLDDRIVLGEPLGIGLAG